MPRKRTDPKTPAAILKTYSAGATLAELKSKHGIRGKGQLAVAVLNALIQSKKLPALKRGPTKKAAPSEFPVKVNTRRTIILPKEAVADAFHFSPGQSFLARRRGKKIILTLAG